MWPEPGQLAAGKDVQIEKGVEVLLADVKAWEERPQPKLRKATERTSPFAAPKTGVAGQGNQ